MIKLFGALIEFGGPDVPHSAEHLRDRFVAALTEEFRHDSVSVKIRVGPLPGSLPAWFTP